MKTKTLNQSANELDALCALVRKMVAERKYKTCIELICEAMENNPHAPQPHNLLGIVLEKLGEHTSAMKHFRAAWALEPTYTPALFNLNVYGTFFSHGKCAFDESDVPPTPSGNIEIVYDERGIGHMVSKTKIEYDKYGVGHIVRR